MRAELGNDKNRENGNAPVWVIVKNLHTEIKVLP